MNLEGHMMVVFDNWHKNDNKKRLENNGQIDIFM